VREAQSRGEAGGDGETVTRRGKPLDSEGMLEEEGFDIVDIVMMSRGVES
jgi:hypothetical protein